MEKKIKYEKPMSLDAGKVGAVLGQECVSGSSPTGSCTWGYDVSDQTFCPQGLAASNNCEEGSSALKSCGAGGAPGWGCYTGNEVV